jgi:hypothetical protein
VIALAVVSSATPAHRAVSTRVTKPSPALSSAVARTQWSVAMPQTSTSDTSWARSQSASASPDDVRPSKPEKAASCSPL